MYDVLAMMRAPLRRKNWLVPSHWNVEKQKCRFNCHENRWYKNSLSESRNETCNNVINDFNQFLKSQNNNTKDSRKANLINYATYNYTQRILSKFIGIDRLCISPSVTKVIV